MAARLSTARLLVFDTETTGIDLTNDRVVELGAAYFEGDKPPALRRMLVNPGGPIPPEATAVHGITDERVKNAPRFEQVGPRFALHLTGEADGLDGEKRPPVLVGYNAVRFDAPLLNAEFHRIGTATRIDEARVVDPFFYALFHHRNLRTRKLTSVCELYGIDLRNAHSAAADATATGQLLLAMVKQGRIPDDVEQALALQHELATRLDAEWARYSYWLYEDRTDGTLRLGAGKYCGAALADVDAGYLDFLVKKIDDLPEATRAAFEGRGGRG
jgi:DNA polymerase III subunit epsilon